MVARMVKSLLGGRYKLSGELVRGSAQRAWDRWLDRSVFIKIFPSGQIATPVAKRRFIATATVLVRIDHPNVESLLDYGATEDGAAYHVMRDAGEELAPRSDWPSIRALLLDVIAGIDALHREGIVHGDISPDSVALIDGTARIVDFADAALGRHDLARGDICDDIHGIAALGYWLLTGHRPIGRTPAAIADALAQTRAPKPVREALLRALTSPQIVELSSLRRELCGDADRPRGWARARLLDAAAGVAACAMLTIGLSSSVANLELGRSSSEALDTSIAELVCDEAELDLAIVVGHGSTPLSITSLDDIPAVAVAEPAIPDAITSVPTQRFEAARARSRVGSEARSVVAIVQTQRFDLRRDLSPATLVERGIDLTHGRPTPEDDPRLPILDGPARARALFEAACARDYGKGCHMLGVQIAEGMIPDDGAGPAEHYRRGCALDYHRSCAALADLARAGQVDADVSMLDAKACLLAGPGSSFCLPKSPEAAAKPAPTSGW